MTTRRAAVDLSVRIAALSARELEVLARLADGLTNETIASELHLSVKTVRSWPIGRDPRRP